MCSLGLSPLEAHLCTEGLARFCTAEYEEPCAENLSNAMAHLTNYSLNKSSDNFQHSEDPFVMRVVMNIKIVHNMSLG